RCPDVPHITSVPGPARACKAPVGREATSLSGGACQAPVDKGLCVLARLAVTAEGDLNDPFIGAAHDGQLDGAAACALERTDQVVGRAYWLTRGRYDQVALGEARAGGRGVLHHLADEQAVGVGQADGTAEPPGDVAGGYGDAEPWR